MCKPNGEPVFVIDRVEQGVFVLIGPDGAERRETGLPDGAREGDAVALRGGAWQLCPEETRRRRERIERKKREIFHKK